MATRVKARPKPIAELPEWIRCCQPMLDAHSRVERLFPDGIEVDASQVEFYPGTACPHCGSPLPKLPAFRILGGEYKDWLMAIEAIDLDEGVATPDRAEREE